MRTGRRRHQGPARTVATLVGVLAALLTLAACATPDRASVSDPRISGTWRLAAASDNGRGIALDGHAITFTIGDAGHTGGTSPCSSYRATVIGGIGAIYIRAQLTSRARADCATLQLNEIEKDYLDALTSSSLAAIDGGSLVLTSQRSHLVFVRAGAGATVALLNSSWRLYALPMVDPADGTGPGLNPVYLRFDHGHGLTISSPCATFAADYRIEGEDFAVTNQHVLSGDPGECTPAERSLAARAAVLLDGPLLIDVNSAGAGGPVTLVVTNIYDDVPVVWRSAE